VLAMGGGNYLLPEKRGSDGFVLIFSVPEKIGALAKALAIFEVENNSPWIPSLPLKILILIS